MMPYGAQSPAIPRAVCEVFGQMACRSAPWSDWMEGAS